MDLRLTFNEDPANYERFRPIYLPRLINDVIRFSKLDNNSNALEIGVGTGQATLPFIQTKSQVTGIELGSDLAKFADEKFREYDNFEVINQDFELVELNEKSFDLVYSASAFHWIPIETGVPKVVNILKDGGVFAWFSVQPMPSDEHIHIHKDMQYVYQNYSSHFGNKSLPEPNKRKIQAHKRKIRKCSVLEQFGFTDITSELYYGSRTYSSNDYVKLLCTYSDHRSMPEEQRKVFLESIKRVIDNNGGEYTLSDIFILCMGRKP